MKFRLPLLPVLAVPSMKPVSDRVQPGQESTHSLSNQLQTGSQRVAQSKPTVYFTHLIYNCSFYCKLWEHFKQSVTRLSSRRSTQGSFQTERWRPNPSRRCSSPKPAWLWWETAAASPAPSCEGKPRTLLPVCVVAVCAYMTPSACSCISWECPHLCVKVVTFCSFVGPAARWFLLS